MKTFIKIFRIVAVSVVRRMFVDNHKTLSLRSATATQHTPATATPAIQHTPATATPTTTVGPGRPSTHKVREAQPKYKTQESDPGDFVPDWDVVNCVRKLQKTGLTSDQALAIAEHLDISHKAMMKIIAANQKSIAKSIADTQNKMHDDMTALTWRLLGYMAGLMTALLTVFATIIIAAITIMLS